MAQDFINNLLSGLTKKLVMVGVLMSVCLLMFLTVIAMVGVRGYYTAESQKIGASIDELLKQQSSTPAGLIAVCTYDLQGNLVDVKGDIGGYDVVAPKKAGLSNLYTKEYLVTFKNAIIDNGGEVRIYRVKHRLTPPVDKFIELSTSNVSINMKASEQGYDFNVNVIVTPYILIILLGSLMPIFIILLAKMFTVKILSKQATNVVIPALAEINDCVVDVTEQRFDTYISLKTDVQVITTLIGSFNEMFVTINDEINLYKNQSLQAKADAESQAHGLANISHEIRTPLNAIYNLSGLSDENTPFDELVRNMKDISQSAVYLLKLINDFLDISKAGADGMQLENDAFDIREVFQSCQMILQQKAEDKGLNLMCHVEPIDGRLLLGDATKLKQIFINLLSNSIKFTNKGDVSLSAKIYKREKNNVTMRFTVKDTGIGMTPAQLENLFTPYQQADIHTQRRYGGTGLGMPISRKMIELMGGLLEADSLEGVGTKFCFNLTFDTTAATDDVVTPARRVTQRNEPPWYGITALVFEDNRTNQRIMEKHLKGVGIEAIIADDGGPGIKIYNERKKDIDLIFMDMNMIEMDGSEATRRLRELGAEQPIILITAMTINNFSSIYKPQGFTDIIEKTFEKEVMWSLLDKYFQEKPKTFSDKLTLSGDVDLLADALHDLKDASTRVSSAYKDQNFNGAFKVCHSVKGVASVINASSLSTMAKDLQDKFQNGEDPGQKAVDALCSEITRVVSKLQPAVSTESLSKEAISMLETVQGLIVLDNMDAIEYVPKLKRIKGTETLIQHLTNYDLMSAGSEIDLMLRRA